MGVNRKSRNEGEEISNLLIRLQSIQKEVGGPVKNGQEQMNVEDRGDKFMLLKSSLAGRATRIRENMEVPVDARANPRETIARQQDIRDEIKMMQEEWNEMSRMHKRELRKKGRYKYTAEEMEERGEFVEHYRGELEQLKSATTSQYTKISQPSTDAFKREQAELFAGAKGPKLKGPSRNSPYERVQQEELTESQRIGLEEVKATDARLDDVIAQIGDGVDELGQIAQGMNEEVKRQNVMLEGLEGKVESANDHVSNVNEKMKETLQKVGRSGEKFCMDVMCVVLLLGIAAVLYSQLT